MYDKTPYKGLLLYHGVGTGKTCSAVTIAENFRDIYGRKVLCDYSLNAEDYLKIDLQMGIYILEIVDITDKSIFKKLIVK